MRISTAKIRSTLSDEAISGLSLSLFTSLMKANKGNSVTPVTHFFRERLKSRADRRALNSVLNAICNSINKSNGGRNKQRRHMFASANAVSDDTYETLSPEKLARLRKGFVRLLATEGLAVNGMSRKDFFDKAVEPYITDGLVSTGSIDFTIIS